MGTDAQVEIAGFVIAGSAPKKVLIRAAGPTMADFGLSGVLDDPVLKLYQGQTVIYQNDDWGADNAASIKATAKRVGAFDWADGSKDAALLVTLNPGMYTAMVVGKGSATGIALVEVYDAD